MKKFITAVLAAITCCMVALFAACTTNGGKKPEKLKEGTALTVTEGESKAINLSEYISIEGTEYAYTANSSEPNIATVSVDGNTATVTAVSKGSATVTVSADEVSVSFAVTVNEKQQTGPEVKPAPVFEDVTVEYDLKDEESKSVTLVPKTGSNTFSYTYALKEQDSGVTITGNKLTVAYEEAAEKQLTIVAAYTDSENASAGEKTVEFKLNITVTDTRDHSDPTAKYKVRNGSFDNGLTGWTMDGEIGEISEQNTFWTQNFPIFNEGKYFSGNNKEAGKGTLSSSGFVVGGVNKISFRLGAAGNKDCYITLEKTDGTVLAIWRNAKFEDVGNWDINEIGKSQFACNLVTYVADLTAYAGETVKIVLNDNAESGFGFFNFDELVTYYASGDDLPENAVVAVNELANKTELKELVDGALTAQGDYTAESYNAYVAKVTEAQAIIDKVSATQTEVDTAKSAIETAYSALRVRTPEEKAGADKSFNLLVNGSKELTISDYVDDKNLSSLTYEVASADSKVTVSAIAGGKFTVMAGNDEVGGATVSVVVKYKDSAVLTVTITVTVTSETAPVLKQAAVSTDIDLYSVENKSDITLDFASNVDNVGGLELSYNVTLNGGALTLDGTSYTYSYGSYTDTATEVVFAVTVSFNQNGEDKQLNYNYTLNIKDTRAYCITNGGFDNGLDGWTLNNPDLGGVNSDQTYWAENIPFNNDGNFFNAYYFDGGAREGAMGTLVSSPFIIGGSGWITYKLGGAKNADKVYLDIIEKDTGNILARYYNNAFSDDGASLAVRGCTLVAYKADLSAHIGKTVYIRLSDNAINDYGLFFVDSFVTYYPEAPAEGNAAVAVENAPANIYQLLNGGFDEDLNGWTVVTTEGPENEIFGALGNADATWGDNRSYNNDGKFFQNMNEQCKGYLTSTSFTVSGNGWMSFKLGGNKANSYVSVIDANTGAELAKFVNENYEGAWPNKGWEMYSYKVNLIESGIAAGTEVRIKVVDDATADYGVVVVDSFAVYSSDPGEDYQKIDKVQ